MTTPMPSQKSRLFSEKPAFPAEHMTAAVLLADLADAEHEFDRIDALGDSAAVARVRLLIGPRIGHLRRALAAAERNRTEGVN